MKVMKRFAVVCIALMVVVLAGCGGNTSPKTALKDAFLKTMNADSYKSTTTLQIDELQLPDVPATDEFGFPMPDVAAIVEGVSLKVNTVHAKSPNRTDMTVELKVPGMMNMQLEVPMIVTDKSVYVKAPSIPMFPLPEELTQKYIQIDLDELNELSGTESAMPSIADQQKLSKEMIEALIKHVDDDLFFSQLKASEVELPDGIKPDRIVKMSIDSENYGDAVSLLIDKLIPEIFTIISENDSFVAAAGVTKEELNSVKSEWDSYSGEVRAALLEAIKLNKIEVITAIKGGYIAYQSIVINIEIVDPESGEGGKIGLSVTSTYSDVGKKPEFATELPTDTLSLEQLMGLFDFPTGL